MTKEEGVIMDIIIGNSDVGLKKMEQDIKTASHQDTVLLYSDNIDLLTELVEINPEISKVTIRGSFNNLNESDVSVCKRILNLKLSLLVDEATDYSALENMISLLTTNGIKYEFFILNTLIDKIHDNIEFVDVIKKYRVNIRVTNRTDNMYKFMSNMKAFQEFLWENGVEVLLKPFSQSSNSKIEPVLCKFLSIDNSIISDFSKYLSINDLGKNKTVEIDGSTLDYTLLPSVEIDDNDAYIYFRESELSKLRNRLFARNKSQPTDNKNKKYDIILIYADRVRNRLAIAYPPMGLHLLNSVIIDSGFASRVVECNEANFISVFNDEIVNKCKVVGFYCACNNETIVTNMSRYIKRNSKDTVVVIGGPQAYSLNEEFFDKSAADVVVEGEGEGAIVELLNYYIKNVGDLSEIKNIKFMRNEALVKNGLREVIADLDSLPFARIKSKDISKYNVTDRIFILTGRGCPNRCTFCYEGANAKKVRYRSMDKVFEEIEYLLNEFPFAGILHVLDDTFTCNQQRVLEFCKRIKALRTKRNIAWVCEAHINNIYNKPELIKEMIDSGLKGFQVGIESGSDMVLKAYKKNTNVKMIKEFANICASFDIKLSIEGNIIIGGPFESHDTINESLELCKYLIHTMRDKIEVRPLFFSPLPNTDITLHPDKYGLEILWDEVNFSMLAMSDAVTRSAFLSREELEKAKKMFDKELDELYLSESLNLNAKQVMYFWDDKNSRFIPGSNWGKALSEYEHFCYYAQLSALEDKNSSKIMFDEFTIPVRTFTSVEYLDFVIEKAKEENYISQVDKKILKACNGKHSVSDISKMYGISLENLKNLLDALAEKCLIKYSVV